MNFLVTGGGDFIGSHVCERLLRFGPAVWALDDQRTLDDTEQLGKPFRFVRGDITDSRAVDDLFRTLRFDQMIRLLLRRFGCIRRFHLNTWG